MLLKRTLNLPGGIVFTRIRYSDDDGFCGNCKYNNDDMGPMDCRAAQSNKTRLVVFCTESNYKDYRKTKKWNYIVKK